MTQPVTPMELETAVSGIYHGPLETFVSRRDALVKELRAAKRREDADRVKLLRKPSRMAWVLDNIVDEDPASIEQLTAAIREAQRGTDLRSAMEIVKAAVRDVASAGARVAIRAGQPVEANEIATAVYAVIGDAGALEALAAGRLVDVPEGGGLEMLTTIGVSAPTTPRSSEPAEASPDAQSTMENAQLVESLRAELRRAETLLAEMHERSLHTTQSLHDAQKQLDTAERELLRAQVEAQARRADVDRARQNAELAKSATEEAERAVAIARQRVIDSDQE